MSSYFHIADFGHYAGDKRTCGESWMQPDPRAQGIRHFNPLPVSTDPLILTDRSHVEIIH